MPIELYTGLQGAGKTYAMVKEAILPMLEDPRWQVLSNLDVTSARSGRRTVDVTDETGRRIDFQVVADLIDRNAAAPRERQCNLLLAVDEIGMAMPQEMWKSDQVLNVVAICLQLRKTRTDFVGTVQHFDRAVKVLRDNTNAVHECSIFKRTWLWWRRDEHGAINRKTGKPFKLPWLFEIESIAPAGINCAPESAGRRKHRIGYRKLKFDRVTATSYDTYQRQAATVLTPSQTPPESEDVEYLATVAARKVVDLRIDAGEIARPEAAARRRRRG